MIDTITEYILNNQELSKYNIDLNEIDLMIENDYINLLREFKLVDKDKLISSYNHNMELVKQFLREHGISIKELKSQAMKSKSIIINGKNKGSSPKQINDEIKIKIIKPGLMKVMKGVKYTKEEIEEPDLGEKITNSLLIFAGMMIISYILLLVFSGPLTLLGAAPQMITIFATIVIAPIVEEYAKRVAILNKYPWVYTGIFAGLEAILYIINLSIMGIPIGAILILRGVAIALHFTTTWLQKYLIEKGETSESDIDWKSISFFAGVAVHMAWNIFGVIYDKDILKLVGVKK